MIKSKKLFARKFSVCDDTEIIDNIDDKLMKVRSYRKLRKQIRANSLAKSQAGTMLTNNIPHLSRYWKLKAELTAEFVPYLLFHKKENQDATISYKENVFEFDDSILQNLGYTSHWENANSGK